MKNFIWAVLGVFLCIGYLPAQTMETIDSISYNPSRMGLYENLKISGGLSSAGGIETSAMTVQSGGTVSIENSGNYQSVSGEVARTLNMPKSRFAVQTLYSSGTASFVDSGKESEISTMNYGSYSGVKLRLRANVLKLAGVEVSGESSRSYSNGVTSGFTLGGNRIPVPASNLSCSELGWYPVLAQTGDNSYQSYKVLGYGKCTGSGTEQSCTENPNQEKCCEEGEVWNGRECVQEGCSAPSDDAEQCRSCSFSYASSNTGATLTIEGTACATWDNESCAWNWSGAVCTPNNNVWLRIIQTKGQLCYQAYSTLWGSERKLSSRPSEGDSCAAYGGNNVSSGWYYFPVMSDQQYCRNYSTYSSCECEQYICTNIAASSSFQY